IAVAELVLPEPLPFTCVDVYSPVTSDGETKRSATLDVLIVLFITFVHPVEQVVVAVVLLLGQETDTVLIAAVAFELCATAAVAKRLKIMVGTNNFLNFIIASV